jgi:hypothetical protein
MKNGNGHDTPLDGWIIAFSQGRTFIGRPAMTPAPDRAPMGLLPVFELHIQPAQGPGGQQLIHFSAFPVLLLASIRALYLPEGAILIQVSELTAPEQKRLYAAVEQGAALQEQLRLADSGIALASEMPRGIAPPRAG